MLSASSSLLLTRVAQETAESNRQMTARGFPPRGAQSLFKVHHTAQTTRLHGGRVFDISRFIQIPDYRCCHNSDLTCNHFIKCDR